VSEGSWTTPLVRADPGIFQEAFRWHDPHGNQRSSSYWPAMATPLC